MHNVRGHLSGISEKTFGWPIQGKLVSQTKNVIYSVIVLRDFPTENSIEGNQLIDLGNSTLIVKSVYDTLNVISH